MPIGSFVEDNYFSLWCELSSLFMTRLLPPAYVVRREGTVFTGVWSVPQGGRGVWVPPGGVRVPPGGVWVPPRGSGYPPGGVQVPPRGSGYPPGGSGYPPGGPGIPQGGSGYPPRGSGYPPWEGGQVNVKINNYKLIQFSPYYSLPLQGLQVHLRAVCLLRSRRKTFLFQFILQKVISNISTNRKSFLRWLNIQRWNRFNKNTRTYWLRHHDR